MKNKITYTLTLLLALLAASCGTDKYNGTFEATRVRVEASNAGSFPAAGGSGTIVLAPGEAYTATSDQKWCKASLSGDTVTVSVDTNKSASRRTALITLAAGIKRNYIPVSQAPVTLEVSVDTMMIFPAAGGSAAITVTAPVNFSATSDQDWCETSISGNTVTVTVKKNTDTTLRIATITIAAGEKNDRVTVFQNEPG